MNPTNTTRYTPFLFLALLAGFILAFFPVWKGLVLCWYTSEDYSHGFFIIPLCLYILWRKKETLQALSLAPSAWGLALVIFSLLVYLLAQFAEILTLGSLSMVLLLAGLVIYLYGFPMLKEVLFPLFLLLFMIPVPSQVYAQLTVPLQLFVSKAAVFAAGLLDVPVYREGNVISLPGRTLQVVQACSGLRSMISLLTLSAVFGYLTLRSNLLRTVLFFSGIPVAILVNIIRVLIMVMAFHYLDYDLSHGTVHTVFGMAVFLLALALIALMKGVLGIWDKSAQQE